MNHNQNQLNLFDPIIDLETDSMSDNQQEQINTTELWSIERLESIPFYPLGKTLKTVENKFFEHKSEGRDGFARALAYEWVVRETHV